MTNQVVILFAFFVCYGIVMVSAITEAECVALGMQSAPVCGQSGCQRCAVDGVCHLPSTPCDCNVIKTQNACLAPLVGSCRWCPDSLFCTAWEATCPVCPDYDQTTCQTNSAYCHWCFRGSTCASLVSYNASKCQYCTSAATESACASYEVYSSPGTTACAWCSTIGSGVCYDSVHYTSAVCPETNTQYVSPIPGEMFLYPPKISTVKTGTSPSQLTINIDLPQTAPYERVVAATDALTFTKFGTDAPNVPTYSITTSNGPNGDQGSHIRLSFTLSPQVLQTSYSPRITTTDDYTIYTWAITLDWSEKAVLTLATKRDDMLYDRAVSDTMSFSLNVPRQITSTSAANISSTSTFYAAIRRVIVSIPQVITPSTPAIIYINFVTKPTMATLYIKQSNMAVSGSFGTWNVSISQPLVLTNYATSNLQEWNTTVNLYSNPCTLTPQDGFELKFKLSGLTTNIDDSTYLRAPITMTSSSDWCVVTSQAVVFTGTQRTYQYGTTFDGTSDPITTYYWLNDEVNVHVAWSTDMDIISPTIAIDQVYVTGSVSSEPGNNLVTDSGNRASFVKLEDPQGVICTGLTACYRFTTRPALFSAPATTGSPLVITTHATISFGSPQRNVRVVSQSVYSTKQASAISLYAVRSAATSTGVSILLMLMTLSVAVLFGGATCSFF